MNAEEVKLGCFQMVLVVLLGINYVIVAMSHALPVFYNHTPKFYCQVKRERCEIRGRSSLDRLRENLGKFVALFVIITACIETVRKQKKKKRNIKSSSERSLRGVKIKQPAFA